MSSRASRLFAASVAALVLGASPVARGDEATAQARFDEGTAAFQRHDYAVAARAFEAANEAAANGAVLFNAAQAWAAAGERARAADALEAALATPGLDAPTRQRASARIAELRPTLARARVTAPAGARVSIDDGSAFLAPAILHARAAGKHTFHARLASGKSVAEDAELRMEVDVAVELREDSAPSAPSAGPKSEPPRPPGSAAVESPGGDRRTAGFIIAGTGVLVVGAAIVVGLVGLGARDDFDSTGHVDQAAHDKAIALRTWSNVLVGVGVGAAVGGLVLVLTAPSSAGGPRTSLLLGPAGASLRASF